MYTNNEINENNEIQKNEDSPALSEQIKRAIKRILCILLPVVVVSLIACLLLSLANAKIKELEANLQAALQEKEKIEITNVHIEEKLSQISELATMSFEYTNQKRINNTREVFGVEIFGTTNTLDIIYSGVIKVGYDIQKVAYEVDVERKIIFLTLPDAEVLDNYIILDNLQCVEKNNIFNPIGTEDVTRYFAEIQEEELAIAIGNGIFTKAENQMKSIIENYFAAFPEYGVVFVS